MKTTLKFTMLGLLGLGLLLGCTKEMVQPEERYAQQPTLAGAAGDPHPALDSICQQVDTIFLINEADGSMVVNKCYGPSGQIQCPNGQLPWGYILVREGYLNGTGYMDCDYVMAPGWYGQMTSWKVGNASTFQFATNGIPIRSNDWGTETFSPYQNKWSLRFPTASLPSGGFDLIIMVQAVRLNLMGIANTASVTNLWGVNPDANDPTSIYYSATSPVNIHFEPLRCMETQVVTEQVCNSMKIGVPALSSCKTISANVAGLTGTLTYQWSTGATTPSITVCPINTTNYSVTISRNGIPVKVNQITLNVSNVACGNGNGNNPNHKVRVCHLPPGNPNNQQDICIDWSGVPAHVQEYRPAGSNQGHNSGCRIGPCSYNPCL